MSQSEDTHSNMISATQEWLERAVIGLNLCPFAKSVHVKQQIRYVVSRAQSPEALCEEIYSELLYLQKAEPASVETSLLIHPYVLQDFTEYNDFLDIADAIIGDLGLEGEIQIASFHPDYQFAGTGPDDIENYTNRSPYPMLQFLRESSISAALEQYPDAEKIFERNILKLRELGYAGLKQLGILALPEDANENSPPNKE